MDLTGNGHFQQCNFFFPQSEIVDFIEEPKKISKKGIYSVAELFH